MFRLLYPTIGGSSRRHARAHSHGPAGIADSPSTRLVGPNCSDLARHCAGGVGAPELSEELKNFSITAGAAAVLGFIFQRDLSGQLRDGAAIEREEALGRLLV